MMVVEKKQPLEKNRNLLGQKQRKVSKSNKQICSPAYGNGPPLFPTGLNIVVLVNIMPSSSSSSMHFEISLQNWILPRTLLCPGFRIFRSTLSPQFPIHQSPCNIHHHRYHLNTRTKLQSHIIKHHRLAEKHRCSIREKLNNKKLDTGKRHWTSMDHQFLVAKRLLPPNPRSRERNISLQRQGRPLVGMGMVIVSPWKVWSTFPPLLSKLTTGRDWHTSKLAR